MGVRRALRCRVVVFVRCDTYRAAAPRPVPPVRHAPAHHVLTRAPAPRATCHPVRQLPRLACQPQRQPHAPRVIQSASSHASRVIQSASLTRRVSSRVPAPRVACHPECQPHASRVIQSVSPTRRVSSRAPAPRVAWHPERPPHASRVIQSAQPTWPGTNCNEREGSPPKTPLRSEALLPGPTSPTGDPSRSLRESEGGDQGRSG